MKIKNLIRCTAALVCSCVVTSHAVPSITGGLAFSSQDLITVQNGGVSAITAFVIGGSQTGSFASVPGGTSVQWSAFTYAPPAATIIPLWQFTSGVTYSFDSLAMVVDESSSTFLNIHGIGVIHIPGYQDTTGTWTLTGTSQNGVRFTFGGTTVAVPDGGNSLMLLGAAFLGLALVWKIVDNSPRFVLTRTKK